MVMEEAPDVTPMTGRSKFSYRLQQFEGPLDLLLYLIQKAQVNIYDIPIAEITDQFLEYLDLAAKLDLDDLTDFYFMAAHLLLIKSRMLLPREKILDDDEQLDDPRTELVERLIEYQKFKRYSQLLYRTSQKERQLLIHRRKTQFLLPFDDSELWGEISVWDLLKTFSTLLRSITSEQVFNVYEEVTTKQKITLMNELFETQSEISFLDLVVRRESPMDVICAFLAILEAVKFHMVLIVQHKLFGDIVIKKRDDFDNRISDWDESQSELDEFANGKGSDDSPNNIQSEGDDSDDYDEIIQFDED